MHELHHSASHFNATISYRHFWAEALIKLAFLYPLVGVIFRAPPGVGTAVALVFALNHQVAHMNLRFEPRFKCLVNHPQYHRLHHSNASRDANINFADLFPMWDFIFGTMRRPAPSEWVDVGLHDDRAPKTVLQGILWPWYRKRQSATAPFPDTT
ncbi:hypothetical protein DBB29_09500 [Pandoraea cepalis]|uniref:Fatty acid hydroxylase domain-containing protein n=1 Tax=Pandoraea cepalis TaxID=2508294 RepID=A0AAW7MM40_9BURK|nr:hypothetical protein [Pandoraea cepalis]MDN4578349.1 hypothetical protein [Pandoraea cepalis]